MVLTSVARKKPSLYVILMGDIVGSELAPSVKVVHRAFNASILWANDNFANCIASPLTITLGDEFQGLLTGLAHAWDLATALRLRLLHAHISCRFVIGTTELETPLNARLAWNMMGPGLAAARDKLNDKKSANAYRFSLPNDIVVEQLADAVGEAITLVELAWTPTQFEYFFKSHNSTRSTAAVAKSLGVSARTLYKVRRAARATFHERQTATLRRALTGLDERYGLK